MIFHVHQQLLTGLEGGIRASHFEGRRAGRRDGKTEEHTGSHLGFIATSYVLELFQRLVSSLQCGSA